MRKDHIIRETVRSTEDYIKQKACVWLAHLLRAPDDTPERNCVLTNGDAAPLVNLIRRVGRPKNLWMRSTLQNLWTATHSVRLSPDLLFNCSNRDDLMIGVWSHPAI